MSNLTEILAKIEERAEFPYTGLRALKLAIEQRDSLLRGIRSEKMDNEIAAILQGTDT